ncbi:MAG: imidazole glycerol phosphate synthase subunit HisH [Eubacteriaceae bacterium]|nr:imidazole glycerol phosphate synthase subunit HisH [Eubacteriaceae bacterium]
MIGIIDYKIGNLANVKNAIQKLGYEAVISDDINVLGKCASLILPGVGAFEDGIKALHEYKMVDFLNDWVDKGKYLLGICLGMQLLFDKSYENGVWDGLSYIKGDIVLFETKLKVPHMGWNSLMLNKNDEIANGIHDGDYVYFVHSYYAKTSDFNDVVLYSEYEVPFPAVVRKGNVIGMQFHPEKSSDVGRILLKNYLEMSKC